MPTTMAAAPVMSTMNRAGNGFFGGTTTMGVGAPQIYGAPQSYAPAVTTMAAAPAFTTMAAPAITTMSAAPTIMAAPQYIQQAPVQTVAAPQYIQQMPVQTVSPQQYIQQAPVQTMVAPQMTQTIAAAPQYIQQAPVQTMAAPQMMQTIAAAPQYVQQAPTIQAMPGFAAPMGAMMPTYGFQEEYQLLEEFQQQVTPYGYSGAEANYAQPWM